MVIHLYSYSKSPNSTARPSNDGLAVEGQLNENSSIINPSISFSEVEPSYNYAYIPVWGRYYYIDNWEYTIGLWRADMRVDALATYKTEIGSSEQYVLRSASAYDGRIIDTSYPTIAQSSTAFFQSTSASPWNLTGGTYSVGIRGDNTSFYLFQPGELRSFFSYLFSDDYADAYVEGWVNVFPQLKAELNPLQYISSITWFPLTLRGVSSSLSVGWGEYPGGAEKVSNAGVETLTVTVFTPPSHPQAAARGSYLNLSPYTRYQLFYPPWGLLDLDSTAIVNGEDVLCSIGVDVKTGMATLSVYSSSGHMFTRVETKLGVSCEFTQVIAPGYGLGNIGATSITAGLQAGLGNFGGAAQTIATAIGDAVKSVIPTATTIGGTGSAGSLVGTPTLQAQCLLITDEDLAHRGRPLCSMRQIDTLSGYVLVANAEVSLPNATHSEADTVTRYMEGGFLFE